MKFIQKDLKNIQKRNRFFTLLEVILFIAIVSIVSTVIGISIGKGVSKYRLEREVKRFYEKFFFIKKMAIANQCDLIVDITQKKKGVLLEIGTSENGGIFPNRKREKEYFSSIYFKFIGDKKIKNSVRLFFYSTGDFYPKGKLRIYGGGISSKKRFRDIDLEKNFTFKKFIN